MVAVNTGNIESLKGMPDVKFDFGVSSSLRTAFSNVATSIEGQRGSRASYRSSGSTDFKGHFSEVFTRNGTTQLADLDEIVKNLRLVVTKVSELEDAARAENGRRAQARAWAQRMAQRNDVQKFLDGIFGSEQPPVNDLADAGPVSTVSASPAKPRETPASGNGSMSGTSSARPADLRKFATSTRDADEALKGKPASLTNHCTNFASSCQWATLDASSVISGINQWLTANGTDATWADTVAGAFEKAGSSGGIATLSDRAIAAALAAAGVAVDRTDIQIDPPIAYGSPPTSGYSDDPVNTATGNFLENEVDLGFTGPAASLGFTRGYSSMNPEVGGFGPGWSSWTECGLTFTDDAARVRLPDGRVVVFGRLGDGWDRATSDGLWLDRVGDAIAMTSTAGLEWRFTSSGRLLSTNAGEGTGVAFGYDEAGRLTSMTHEFGRSLVIEWDGVRVAAVTANDGRRVDYRYDEAGHLLSVGQGDSVRQYRWNDAGLICAVIDADGVVEAENVYDETGRVVTQRSPFGRVTRYAYLPGGITVTSDADGERANTWITDGRGRLVGVIDADDQRQSTAYDRWSNPVMVTERDGSVTLTEYDDRGRKVLQVVPSGARLGWVYDDAGRPVEVSVESDDSRAVTLYAYEGSSRNPSVTIDPSGGITRMTWQRGLLTKITDPTGVAVTFTHDEHGDLVATTDAEGNVARLERDEAGRVIAAVTPLGFRTTYRYSEAGALLSRTDPDGARWTYEHTSGGRISAVIDPLGGRTSIEHGSTGERERVTDPLGRAVATSYDDLGNLATVELPDGSAWRFGYDAASRLVEAQDASGGTWQLAYGANGLLSGAVDATGVQRAVRNGPLGLPERYDDGADSVTATYDRLGRMVSVMGPDGQPSVRRYDLCGRVVESIDAAGGVTRIDRDAAGRVVAVTQPTGGTFRYEYDACGRWVATISTGGDRYSMHYDADSRIVGETWPTGEQVHTEHDECGRVLQRTEPGRGTTRFRYDLCGRIVRIRDPWVGRRSFAYDLAGQLVQVTNALGGVTRFEYDGLGRQVAVVDPLGGRTTRTFDGMSRLLTETDPLGRVTSYTYDAAGRQIRRVDASGQDLCWRYDATGREVETVSGDRVLSTTERDFAGRSMRVIEGDTVHELAWDANGNLVRRLRDGVGVHYSYDAGGRRTSMTRPDGTTTQYFWDANSRLAALEQSGLGRAVLGRDALGRLVRLDADGVHSEWTYADGHVVARETNRRGFLSHTRLERDAEGRVVAETTDGLRTAFTYDAAGQLVATSSSEGLESRFEWDANGRLAVEVSNGRATKHAYDAAGQLLASVGESSRVSYEYDGAGRRVRRVAADGVEERYSWDPQGFLARVTQVIRESDRPVMRSRELHVDALGELARVDATPVWWDSAAGAPALAQVGSDAVTVTGLGAVVSGPDGQVSWSLPGMAGSAWGVSGAGTGVPGVTLTADGGLQLDGLDWLGARVYDSGARGMLSTDPLRPVTGAAWSGNPYSYAGNDPVNSSDPLGLRPITDAELQAYRDSNHGMLGAAVAAASDWWANNWEYVAAGALIVGGVALMCTGIGGPIGGAMLAGALTGAGSSIWSQKSQNGSVDWGKVAIDGALGAATGLIGGGAAAAGVKATSGMTNCLGKNILSGAISGGIDGGASGGISYLTSGQPITVNGLLSATAQGAGTGMVMGGAGGALSKVTDVGKYGCFTAETAVLMADGSSKPIADVVVGDEVLAFNPETEAAEPRRVTDTFVHEQVATIDVTTSAGVVTTTLNHPFYAEGRGWIPAGDLHEGDRLRSPDGSLVEVVSIQATGRSETVHNLAVEGLHNYHVATNSNRWILVHNIGNRPCDEDEIVRIYEHNPKHRTVARPGPGGNTISRAPRGDAQAILDASVPDGLRHRLGIEPSTGLTVQLRQHLRQEMDDGTIKEFYHGYVPGG